MIVKVKSDRVQDIAKDLFRFVYKDMVHIVSMYPNSHYTTIMHLGHQDDSGTFIKTVSVYPKLPHVDTTVYESTVKIVLGVELESPTSCVVLSSEEIQKLYKFYRNVIALHASVSLVHEGSYGISFSSTPAPSPGVVKKLINYVRSIF